MINFGARRENIRKIYPGNSEFQDPFFCFRMEIGFLGFGRNFEEILPTSLPGLHIQLRELRNNLKSIKICFCSNTKCKSCFFDLDRGFQTFRAGSREEHSCRIIIFGPRYLFLSSRVKHIGKPKTIKFYVFPFYFPLYSV